MCWQRNADVSLARAGDIKGELVCVWGRQDPHVPLEGRIRIRHRLEEAGVFYQWHEFNAQHAFLRDEGPRYDPGIGLALLRPRHGAVPPQARPGGPRPLRVGNSVSPLGS